MPTYLKPHNPSNDINCQQILSHIQSCPVCQLLWRAPGGYAKGVDHHDFALPKLSSDMGFGVLSPAVAILILIIIVLIIMYVVKQ
jgi:hypothetical protein